MSGRPPNILMPSDETAYSSPHHADLAKTERLDQLLDYSNVGNGFVVGF